MQHFRRLLDNVNVEPLLAQLRQHPELWNIDDSWTRYKPNTVAIYNTDNVVLRYNKSSQEGWYDWNKPAFTVLTEAVKIIFDVMRAIPGEHLGKLIITRLRPGEVIREHIDRMPPGIPIYWQRYQIPLSVKPGVHFDCGGERLYMAPGTAWWFDNQQLHSVINESNEDRISMLADVRPFQPVSVGKRI